jgi:hypothetical protein
MNILALLLRLAITLLLCGSTVSFQTASLKVPSISFPRSKKWNDVLVRIDSLPSWYHSWPYVSSISLSVRSQSTQEFDSSQSSPKLSSALNEKQLDFTCGYLNKHHSDVLAAIAETLSPLGEIKSKRNSWSGGSYKIESATLVDINTLYMTLEVRVQQRSKVAQVERVTVNLGRKETGVLWCINTRRIFLNIFLCRLVLQMPYPSPKLEAMEAIATTETSTCLQFLGI